MRPSFSAGDWIKQRAKREAKDSEALARRWWAKRYGQSPKPYLEYSITELIREMYVELYWQRDEVMTEIEHRHGDKTDLYERLSAIDKALEDETEPKRYSPDPLIDKWERELAEGKEIDLDEQWVG
jgi:hypothetical protein